LIWAVGGRPAPSTPLAADQLPRLWEQLADADAAKAHRALWALVAGSRQALPFLAEQVKPVPPPDARTTALISQLESDQFAVRQKASEALEELGEAALPALRQKLTEKSGLDMRQRLEKLLEKLDGKVPSAAALRLGRSVQVLEYIGDAEARKLLDKLACGLPTARLTQEAQGALERLSKRPGGP
jgi:hypothetical protein